MSNNSDRRGKGGKGGKGGKAAKAVKARGKSAHGKGGVGGMVKIWGGSGRRTVRGAAMRGGAMLRTSAGADEENVIDYETFLTWYTEYNLVEAAGNERSEHRTFSQKRKSLKFLSL